MTAAAPVPATAPGHAPGLGAQDAATLTALEETMWRPETRFDPLFQQRHFAPDFVEFGRSGRVYRRADIVGLPAQAIDCLLPLPNLALRALDVHTALLTYDSAVGPPGARQWAHRSSVWTRGAQGWVMRFHQGTPFVPADTPPSSDGNQSTA